MKYKIVKKLVPEYDTSCPYLREEWHIMVKKPRFIWFGKLVWKPFMRRVYDGMGIETGSDYHWESVKFSTHREANKFVHEVLKLELKFGVDLG